ncbi:MAG: PQQ-binding-like beta-propeller repeat protein [Planctomycetota bacterium]
MLPLSVFADDNTIDWPTFQGNNARTGASDAPAITKPTVSWSTKLGIMGYLNCPVIDGEFVFVTSSGDRHNVPDDRDGVYCLSMKTGEILWHTKTRSDACGITIDQEQVYVGDDSGRFYALNRETGEVAWETRFFKNVFAQPVVTNGLVVVGDGEGTITAFETKLGKAQWKYEGPGAIRGGLSSIHNRIYAAFLHGRVCCFDLKGNLLWQKETFSPGADGSVSEQVYPAPTLTKDGVYIAFARDTMFDVPALAAFSLDGDTLWFNEAKDFERADGKSFANLRNSPAVYKDKLVYGEPYSNEMHWSDRATGAFVGSTAAGKGHFRHWPSVVIAGNTAYLGRHNGGFYAIDLSGDAALRWTVYLGNHDLAGVDNTPAELRGGWEPNVGRPIYATPAIAKDGTLVIGTGEGWLYCIRESAKH